MRVPGKSIRLGARRLLALVLVGAASCHGESARPAALEQQFAAAAGDSLANDRADVVSDLRKRIQFLLSTGPNAPTVGIYGGGAGDTTIVISIANDSDYIAPRLVLESPVVLQQLRGVGYRAVAFREARFNRVVILPFVSPPLVDRGVTASAGFSGELARRYFADDAAKRLRPVGADVRARGAAREILYLSGLTGSSSAAFAYANLATGGMLAMSRLRSMGFDGLIIEAGERSWCWDPSGSGAAVACDSNVSQPE